MESLVDIFYSYILFFVLYISHIIFLFIRYRVTFAKCHTIIILFAYTYICWFFESATEFFFYFIIIIVISYLPKGIFVFFFGTFKFYWSQDLLIIPKSSEGDSFKCCIVWTYIFWLEPKKKTKKNIKICYNFLITFEGIVRSFYQSYVNSIYNGLWSFEVIIQLQSNKILLFKENKCTNEIILFTLTTNQLPEDDFHSCQMELIWNQIKQNVSKLDTSRCVLILLFFVGRKKHFHNLMKLKKKKNFSVTTWAIQKTLILWTKL